MSAVRVLIADDQDLVRLGLAMVINAEDDMTVVGEAADGQQALRGARELVPDVVLMDVRMPQLDGVEATRRLVAELPQCRVIIMTTFDLDAYAFGGLSAGASGFLLKDSTRSEILAAIRAVAAGDAALTPRITRKMLDLFGDQLPVIGGPAPPDRLAVMTDREREVFSALVRGLSNLEIAAELHLSESTVKTHVGRILTKLQLRDRVQAVIWAHRAGLN
jgi:DNA-binding NarL/FixJ family response regulator